MANVLWHDLILGISLDVPEQLLFSLDLEHHLTMDILDVEVLASHHQGPSVAQHIIVQGVVAAQTTVSQAQAVVAASRLLQRVNRLRLSLRIWGSAAAHLWRLLHFGGRRAIIGALNIHILGNPLISSGLLILRDLLFDEVSGTHIDIKVLKLI